MRRGSAEQMAKEKKIAIATSIRICGLHVRVNNSILQLGKKTEALQLSLPKHYIETDYEHKQHYRHMKNHSQRKWS